ncbi:DUF4359 domain-containing protein [Peribacillus asahii]|uniref:DUF4359 domain-containing protein n=1 Tax=Peribacillus asahii TaxID=228899 RepID=UPI00207A0526|nr:DUF4359 domain-containing protein [Peribacillus asahii]USK61363.1 DUF4359 domain-containing protein [Peribacillus asahii]
MKKYIISIALLIIVLFATTSNPSKADYVSFVKEEISDEGGKFLGIISGPFIDTFTTKKNFGLFSLYETKFEEDEEKLLAIGLFNNFIWISTPESSPKK